jgi:hypothetical protein
MICTREKTGSNSAALSSVPHSHSVGISSGFKLHGWFFPHPIKTTIPQIPVVIQSELSKNSLQFF